MHVCNLLRTILAVSQYTWILRYSFRIELHGRLNKNRLACLAYIAFTLDRRSWWFGYTFRLELGLYIYQSTPTGAYCTCTCSGGSWCFAFCAIHSPTISYDPRRHCMHGAVTAVDFVLSQLQEWIVSIDTNYANVATSADITELKRSIFRRSLTAINTVIHL